MSANLTTRRAPVRANSYDPASRTFEATIATTTPVQRGDFAEVLDLSGPLPGSLPFLNGHRQGNAGDVIGRVEKVRREGAALVASIRLSGREDVRGIAQDIADGILTDISVGYRISDAKTTDKGGTRTVTVVPEIIEASLVPVGADQAAKIRSAAMADDETNPATEAGNRTARAASRRAIESLADEAGLDQAFVERAIEEGLTERAARALAFEELRERGKAASQIRNTRADVTTGGNPVERRAALADGFASRALGTDASDNARAAMAEVGGSLLGAAQDALERAGERTRGLAPVQVIQRAFSTTSDYPILLQETANRVLAPRFEAALSPIVSLARKRTAPDFRALTEVRVGSSLRLLPVNEHGELKAGTLVEAKESFKIGSFGLTFGLSFQALANDDLGAFGLISSDLAEAGANTLSDLVVDLIVANPKLGDGKAVFHADHKTLHTGASSALSATSLATAVLAMRKQTGLAGERIRVSPTHLVVPPELELTAKQLLATINATTVEDTNPWASAFTLVVEPRLTDTKAWYLVDPTFGDLVVAHLAGFEGVTVETQQAFDTLGTRWRAHAHFGSAFTGFRGWSKSAGQ